MLTTVLDALDLYTDLNASLFQVRMGPDTHRLSCSDLTPWPDEVILFLIHGHSLVDVGLHQLILRILIRHRHAFVAALARVSDPLDGLLLRVRIHVDLGSSKGRVLCRVTPWLVGVDILVAFHLRRSGSCFVIFKAKLGLLKVGLMGHSARHCTVRSLVSPIFHIRSIVNEHLLVLIIHVWNYLVLLVERLDHDTLVCCLLLLIHLECLYIASWSSIIWTRSSY